MSCFFLVLQEKPSLLLVNGPGTCIPVAFCVVFIESFCRVQKCELWKGFMCRLSVSGYLLYYVADSFLVQWPQLQKKYSRSVYLGILM